MLTAECRVSGRSGAGAWSRYGRTQSGVRLVDGIARPGEADAADYEIRVRIHVAAADVPGCWYGVALTSQALNIVPIVLVLVAWVSAVSLVMSGTSSTRRSTTLYVEPGKSVRGYFYSPHDWRLVAHPAEFETRHSPTAARG
jgi:hypothetical protein